MLLPIAGSASRAGRMLFASAWCWAGGGHSFTPVDKPPCNTSSFTATPHPPSIARCTLGIMSGCKGWRCCGKTAEPRAFLLAHFLVHYKPVMPKPGPLDKMRLHLTRIGVHRGRFSLWSLSQCGFLLLVPFDVSPVRPSVTSQTQSHSPPRAPVPLFRIKNTHKMPALSYCTSNILIKL